MEIIDLIKVVSEQGGVIQMSFTPLFSFVKIGDCDNKCYYSDKLNKNNIAEIIKALEELKLPLV